MHAMRPDPDVHIQVNDDYLPPYVDYDNPVELEQGDPELTLYTQFYKATVQLADNAERRDGRCHNYKETGHFWHECQQPLREEFKHLMDRTHQCQEELNKNGVPEQRVAKPPGGSSTTTACDASQGTGHGPTVNNKEQHPPYWNDDPRTRWLGLLNVDYAYIDGHQERVLIDSGARCNTMSPEYAKACKVRVGPVHELAMSPQDIPIQGIVRNTNALGSVVINVQIGGIPSYNEEQITLVIEDISGLGMRVPVILGMPTIHRLCHQMKDEAWTTRTASGTLLTQGRTLWI